MDVEIVFLIEGNFVGVEDFEAAGDGSEDSGEDVGFGVGFVGFAGADE